MTWIKTIPASEAGPELQAALDFQRTLFPPEYAERVPAAGREHSSGVVASHSLIPEALRHAFGTYGVLLSPDLPLTRRQHEMIAVVVSQGRWTTRWWRCCGGTSAPRPSRKRSG
jgi:hypothetical protein